MLLPSARHHGLQRATWFRRIATRNSSTSVNRAQSAKPYYITTPIFYPNAVPHIGHLYTLVLGDVFARYRRLVEPTREVKFLAGTDEHGLKIQQAASSKAAQSGEAGGGGAVDVRGFCDELSQVFKASSERRPCSAFETLTSRLSETAQDLSKSAGISHTTFARTTEDRHRATVEHVWVRASNLFVWTTLTVFQRTLSEKGYIYKGEYEGWYSITDECFYTTPQVVQTPESLADPNAPPIYISKETGSKVEWSKEFNYMFRLSAFRDALIQRYSDDRPTTTVFPAQYNSVVLQMLSADSTPQEEPLLADISISRPRSRLTWGIPVPEDPEHTVYVWFDALLIYLSGVGYPWSKTTELAAGWPADLQIIGKDIVRFHAIYLPAILLALSGPHYSELASTSTAQLLQGSPGLPKRLLTHAHWTVSQAKMSKSVGNVVDPLKSMEKYGVDIVRFYLARVGGRFRDDVDWSFEQLEKHSKELQSLLGNYLLRVSSARITATAAIGRDQVLHKQHELHPLNSELLRMASALPSKVQSNMEGLEVAEVLVEILDVLKFVRSHLYTEANCHLISRLPGQQGDQ